MQTCRAAPFFGWYCNDELVSTDEIYRFPVKEDIELQAKFSEVELFDIAFESDEEIQEDLKEDLNEEEKVVDVMTGNGISYVFVYLICAMAVIILVKGKLNVYEK